MDHGLTGAQSIGWSCPARNTRVQINTAGRIDRGELRSSIPVFLLRVISGVLLVVPTDAVSASWGGGGVHKTMATSLSVLGVRYQEIMHVIKAADALQLF